jgi:GTPase SAR1 family protein
MEHKRVISTNDGKELAKQYGIPFIETSAKDTINIEDLFLGITKNFLEKQASNSIKKEKKEKNLKNNKPISVEKLSEQTKNKKKGGCC